MKTRTLPAILSFDLTVLWAKNLTPLDLAEIENLLYKHRWARVLGQGGCVQPGGVQENFCGRLWRLKFSLMALPPGGEFTK